MRSSPLLLACGLTLLLAIAGCSSDGDGPSDPCRRVVCLEGQDCRAGACVDRVEDDPVGCQSNNDCQFNPRGALCEKETGFCVACFGDSQCPEGRRCEVGICAGEVCTTDGDCGADAPICAVDGRSCLQCTGEDLDACAEGQRCEGGLCVDGACGGDDDCEGDTPYCADEACVACRDESHCAADQICDGGSCVADPGCASDADCQGSDEGAFCEVESGGCVPCLDDGSCPLGAVCVERAACEPMACDAPGDCPAGSLCEDERCVALEACGSDADCTADPRVPKCNFHSVCVECMSDAHCGAGARCVDEACVARSGCATDSDCDGAFVCAGAACVSCRSDVECPRGACIAGGCVDRASCQTDAACAEGICVDGSCAACMDDLDCRQGLWCEDGACAEAPPCASNDECAAGSLCDGATCQPFDCDDDSFEPDGGPASASPISLGAPLSRSLCPNDEDWLAFAAPPRSALDVSFLSAPEGVDVSLVYFEPDDARARREIASTARRLMIPSLPTAASGRYFLRVRGSGGAHGAYTFLAKAGTTACTDPYEPNNALRDSKQVPANEWQDGLTLCDVDFYSVRVPADHGLSAYVILADGDAQVSLFTAEGNALPGARSESVAYQGGGRAGLWDGGPAETEVVVRVSPRAEPTSGYRLFLATAPRLACGAPIPLLAGGADRARVVGATLGHALGSGVGLCGIDGPEVEYGVRFDSPGRLVAKVDAAFAASLSLRTASCGAEQSCMGTLQGFGTLDVPRLSAGDYVLAVGGGADEAGSYDLALRKLPALSAPSNDGCAQARELELGTTTVTVSGTTGGATPSGGGLCNPLAPDVFYTFTLNVGARLVAEASSALPIALSLLDPACVSETGCRPAARSQRLDVDLPAGTHVLRMSSPTGAAAAFTLQATLPAPLPNDSCGSAQVVGVPGAVSGNTSWAKNNLSYPLQESCTGYYLDGGDLFYVVALAQGQSIDVALTPEASYDPALYVIESCTNTQCLIGVDVPGAGVPEALHFTAPRDGLYYLVVDGAGPGGSFTLQVSGPP